MKVYYSKKLDMYLPQPDWYEDNPDYAGQLEEKEVTKEEIIVEGGDDEPYYHGEVWELNFESEHWMSTIGTKIPWKEGKYKITIEEILTDKNSNECSVCKGKGRIDITEEETILCGKCSGKGRIPK